VVTLQRLRYFCMLMESKSLRDAALALGISEATCSQQIRLLEEEFQLSLFERQGRVLSPTVQAESLFQYVKQVLADTDMMYDVVEDLREARSLPVRVATTHSGAMILLPTAIKRLSQEFRSARIQVEEAGTYSVVRRVIRGDCDLGIAALSEDLVEELLGRELMFGESEPNQRRFRVNMRRIESLSRTLESEHYSELHSSESDRFRVREEGSSKRAYLTTVRLESVLVGTVSVLFSPDHILAKQAAAVDTTSLAGENLILVRAGYALNRIVGRQIVGKVGSEAFRSIVFTENNETSYKMVYEGVGISFIVDFPMTREVFGFRERGLIVKPLVPPCKMSLALVMREDRYVPGPIQRLVELIRESVAGVR